MERRLISDTDQYALRFSTGTVFDALEAKVRARTNAPASWRIEKTFEAFYNPAGMTQGEIDAYDALKRAERRDSDLAYKALQALATAVHKRFKAKVPTDNTTVAEWKAAIVAEWDALS